VRRLDPARAARPHDHAALRVRSRGGRPGGARALAAPAARPGPARDYRDAAGTVLAAFAADGVLARDFTLPEFAPRQRFPAAQAISFHFIDYVVHSWDVARALGLPVSFGPGLLAAARGVASQVPGGDARLRPGAAFAPAVTWPGPGGLDEIVALLGRSPAWPS
jgi:uncharacterized protein (TIGR03086 family)